MSNGQVLFYRGEQKDTVPGQGLRKVEAQNCFPTEQVEREYVGYMLFRYLQRIMAAEKRYLSLLSSPYVWEVDSQTPIKLVLNCRAGRIHFILLPTRMY